MSVKKNLTVATLAALLAVPAFGATHNNAHAAYNSNSGVMLSNSEAHIVNPHFIPGTGPAAQTYSGSAFNSGHEQDSIGYYNGHSFEFPDNGGWIVTKLDGQSNPSLAEVRAALGESGSSNNSITENTNTSASGKRPEYQNSKTNNGKLVQTGENNGASKAAALGATALTASLGLMALSFAKKHKDLETIDTATDNVSAANGNKPHYSNKSNYDMIMNHTFASLSKHLNNL